MVEQVAYTKWQVPNISAQDAWEIYSLRGVREGFGARLTTESMNDKTLALLNKAYQELEKSVNSGDRSQTVEADFSLHRTIIALSGHQRLKVQYDLLQQQVRRYMCFSTDVLHIPEDILNDHKTLVSAIIDGDAENAVFLAKNHNMEECQVLHDLLIKQNKVGEDSEFFSPPAGLFSLKTQKKSNS